MIGHATEPFLATGQHANLRGAPYLRCFDHALQEDEVFCCLSSDERYGDCCRRTTASLRIPPYRRSWKFESGYRNWRKNDFGHYSDRHQHHGDHPEVFLRQRSVLIALSVNGFHQQSWKANCPAAPWWIFFDESRHMVGF